MISALPLYLQRFWSSISFWDNEITRKSNLSPQEQRNIESIEQLRDKLLKNKNAIPLKNYGAGSKTNPTEEIIGKICRAASKKKNACLVLYYIIKNTKPLHALELGTCLGISAAYQALALKENKKGKIISIEGSEGRAQIAKENIEALGLSEFAEVINGRFEDVLISLLQRLEFVDFAFIDGHHNEEATLKYFNIIAPYFKKGGVIVFDDIFWSAGMNRAWKTIKASGKLKNTTEKLGMGIGIL